MTSLNENQCVTADARRMAAEAWATEALGQGELTFSVASADASFRRYFRARQGDASWIVMDAPPERENCGPFVDIAARLARVGVHVPEVLAADIARGFLLLADLGNDTFLGVINTDNANAFFSAALDALVKLQTADTDGLPDYDAALLQRELDLFPDWYLGRHLDVRLSPADKQTWTQACALLIESACAQPQVFVHRDYMPRNLMVSEPLPGVIDFQDAVRGPVSYDLASLFSDAFVSWPSDRIAQWVAAYCNRADSAGIVLPDDFERAFDWMGLQRHLKVIGIFARLHYRDGKEKYLNETPRFFRYVYEVGGKYPEFASLLEVMKRYDRKP